MSLPKLTRLRYVRARSPEDLESFFRSLGQRVQIYSINKDKDKWVAWFVPGDRDPDIQSVDF